MAEAKDIDRIREYSDIVRLIEEYFPLKKAGANYKALCPFHQEKTPSFVVSPEKQIYHCFGCGKSGDVFNFLMEMEGIDFPEAIKRLAEQAGIKLDSPQNEKYRQHRELNKKIINLNRRAAEFYHRYLKSPAGRIAYEYLKNRGLNDGIIEKFLIGYAPPGSRLVNKADGNGVDQEILLKSGLAGESKNGKLYDKFRDRIIYPIMDERGQIKGFGGRVINDSDSPKYLNTAQTRIFNKKEILYGLKQGKNDIRKNKKLLLLEGYMDVIAAHQNNIPYAVATLGTALTTDHIYKIKHWVEEVVFCFDSDEAGANATLRAVEMVMESEFTGRVCELPTGKDPEDIIRENKNKFMDLIKEAEEVIDWRVKFSINKFANTSGRAQRKINIIGDLTPVINKIRNNIKKEEVIKILSEKIKTDELAVKTEVERGANRRTTDRVDYSLNELPLIIDETTAKELLHLALRHKDICPDIKKILENIVFMNNRYLKILRKYLNEYNCSVARLASNSDSKTAKELSELSIKDIKAESPETKLKQLEETMIHLRKVMYYNELKKELKEMYTQGRPVPEDKKNRFSRLARELNRNKTIKIGK